ncbi:dsDNA nuclease domain-containing protein [Vibrio barjaei]|uniref:DsDNA nuclease domain-containing protein n=1 Tax=Vibrio barjaei TaxID=1676683 RepID=A0ABW7IRJ3_9VIBR
MENYVQSDEISEEAGAKVFAKYWYQYNWALIKFLEECESRTSCSLSIECHEDVLIIDRKEVKDSQVSLYQVKERSESSNYTAKSLAYSNPNSKSKSVISKLVSNLDKEHLKGRIARLALVSATPFNISVNNKHPSEKLHSFRWEDIKEEDSEVLLESIKKELSKEEAPLFIEFIKGVEAKTEVVHSSIALNSLTSYIEEMFPQDAYRPKVIFEALRTELIRIGTNTTIYPDWNDFLKFKTITSEKLNNVIRRRSITVNGNAIIPLWAKVTEEADLKSLPFVERAQLKTAATNYCQKRIQCVNSAHVQLSSEVFQVLENTNLKTFNDYVSYIVDVIASNDEILFEYFDKDRTLLKAAVMIELVECV